jgi:hypothetical protein
VSEEYHEGQDCECMARSEGECGCSADWTPSEVYTLRKRIADLEKQVEFEMWQKAIAREQRNKVTKLNIELEKQNKEYDIHQEFLVGKLCECLPYLENDDLGKSVSLLVGFTSVSEALDVNNLEQQAKGVDTAIAAAVELGLLDNDVYNFISIKAEARKRGAE